jgi:GNAT superfamily N-acetyltransferase
VFACAVSHLSAIALLAHHGTGSTFLLALYVDPSIRGQGLGRELLGRTVQYLRSEGLQCCAPLQPCVNRAIASPEYTRLLREHGFLVGMGSKRDSFVIELQ